MSFQLADLTALAVAVYVAAVLALVAMVAGAVVFVATHRRERLVRQESLRSYYGHLVLAH